MDHLQASTKMYGLTAERQAAIRKAAGDLPQSVLNVLLRGFMSSQLHQLARRAIFASGPALTGERARLLQDAHGEQWKQWCLEVLDIDVQIEPGGRAILQRRSKPPIESAYRVETQWRAKRSDLYVAEMRVIQGGPGQFYPPDLAQYATALTVEVRRRGNLGRGPIPTDRPEAGRQPKTDYYRRVLAYHDMLVAQGSPAPAREIAERWGLPYSTVRSLIARGRRYLERDPKEER